MSVMLGVLPIQYLKDMLGVNLPLTVRHTWGSQLSGHSMLVSLQVPGWRFIARVNWQVLIVNVKGTEI